MDSYTIQLAIYLSIFGDDRITFTATLQKFGALHEFACHLCAGVPMLIFSAPIFMYLFPQQTHLDNATHQLLNNCHYQGSLSLRQNCASGHFLLLPTTMLQHQIPEAGLGSTQLEPADRRSNCSPVCWDYGQSSEHCDLILLET